jgi:magnesium transporter
MLTLHNLGLRGIPEIPVDDHLPRGTEPLWFDLLEPSLEEVKRLERLLSLELPTKFDMEEIESSSRLYTEDDAIFMTALMMAHADSSEVETAPVSFIVANRCLITVRFVDNLPFRNFQRSLGRSSQKFDSPFDALVILLDSIIDRLADILERVGQELDQISHDVFNSDVDPVRARGQTNILKETMNRIGRNGETASKARESLVSLNRLLVFLINFIQEKKLSLPVSHLKGLGRDLASLSDHASFLSSKIGFLLDATLGLINIEQNQIIKIFSIAAVIFLPPTVIASIYGMNFDILPEKHWDFGYPFALFLMVISAITPYWYFRRKGWI